MKPNNYDESESIIVDESRDKDRRNNRDCVVFRNGKKQSNQARADSGLGVSHEAAGPIKAIRPCGR